jgi:hypothetical protein
MPCGRTISKASDITGDCRAHHKQAVRIARGGPSAPSAEEDDSNE